MGLEELRNLHLKSQNGTKVSVDEEGDWPREFNKEFPFRHQIRNWVREEFVNRWRNIGLKYTDEGEQLNSLESPMGLLALQNPDELPEWDNQLYKGPKTAWVRVASNVIAPSPFNSEKIFKGFVMQGNGNFHDTYGFDKGDGSNGGGGDAETLLGYDQSTPPQRHVLEEPDYKHRPTPGITSIESEDLNPSTGNRRTTVNFTCWSVAQLDYLEVYFFAPGKTVSVEWGWNTFPRDSLLPLNDDGLKKRVDIWNNKNVDDRDDFGPKPGAAAKHTRLGRGNYAWAFGIITKFSFTIRADGGFDCTIQIQNPVDISRFIQQKDSTIDKQKGTPHTYKDFIYQTLSRLLKGNKNADYSRWNKSNRRTGKDLVDEANRRKFRDATRSQKVEDTKISDLEKEALMFSRGRFFTFDTYSSSKPYYAGKDNAGGSYITVGFFIDTINIFFGRESGVGATMCEFSCWNSRAVAHFNIKSCDGDVLLIPNELAPRWNGDTLPGLSTVGAMANPEEEPAAYDILKKGESGGMYSSVSSSFLDMVNALFPSNSPAKTIEVALKNSPRDNLHKYLSHQAMGGYNLQHPSLLGNITKENKSIINTGKPSEKLDSAWDDIQDTVRPFPDFDPTINSDGYSGRISDLFININIIKEAVKKNSAPHQIILDVMKKASEAANGIWDFQLIGGDFNTSSPTVLQLVDMNYTGSKPVHRLKEKAWVFPVHRGDSIVRAMDWSNELSNEIASATVFSVPSTGEDDDALRNFYEENKDDMIFIKKAKMDADETESSVTTATKQSGVTSTTQSQIDSAGTKEEIPDSEKFIIAQSTFGFKRGEVMKFTKYKEDSDLTGVSEFYYGGGVLEKPKKKIKKKTFWISFIYPKTGKKITLEADNAKQRDHQINMAKRGYGVKDKDIMFAPGSQWTSSSSSQDEGDESSTLNRFGTSAGVGAMAKKRVHKIWVDDEWVQDQDNFSGAYLPLDGPVTDDIQIKELIGKIISYNDNNDVDHDKKNPPKSGKEYKIISAAIPRDADGNYSDVDTDGYNQAYVLHIEEVTPTLLNNSQLQRLQQSQLNSQPVPADIDKFMKKHNLSTDDAYVQQHIKYKSTGSSEANIEVTTRKVDVKTYGSTQDGYEVDIEMVDPDKDRMLKFCKSDNNEKNNLIFNSTINSHKVSLTFDGIEGLRLYDIFDCTGVPTKFYKYGTYVINSISHSISDGDWQTTIEADWAIGKTGQVLNFKDRSK